MKWFVLYTKPNYELKVAQGINTLGINAYCPTFTQIKHYSDRKKKGSKAIITFLCIGSTHRTRPSQGFCYHGGCSLLILARETRSGSRRRNRTIEN